MTQIPSGTKFVGISSNVPTPENRSSLSNSYQEIYTIEDIIAEASAADTNIYNSDGTITENRTVSIDDKSFVVQGNDGSGIQSSLTITGTSDGMNLFYTDSNADYQNGISVKDAVELYYFDGINASGILLGSSGILINGYYLPNSDGNNGQVLTTDGNGVTNFVSLPAEITVAASDETTALTTGTAKITFRMPHAMTVTGVRASLSTAQTSGSIFTVDINEGGSSILSTKLTIDNTEKTSTTAATPAVISDSALADDAEITIDIDQIGDGTAKGLKVVLIGTRA